MLQETRFQPRRARAPPAPADRPTGRARAGQDARWAARVLVCCQRCSTLSRSDRRAEEGVAAGPPRRGGARTHLWRASARTGPRFCFRIQACVCLPHARGGRGSLVAFAATTGSGRARAPLGATARSGHSCPGRRVAQGRAAGRGPRGRVAHTATSTDRPWGRLLPRGPRERAPVARPVAAKAAAAATAATGGGPRCFLLFDVPPGCAVPGSRAPGGPSHPIRGRAPRGS